MRLTRPGLGKGFGPLGPSLYKEFRVYMERDPIVLFSCIIGLFGMDTHARTLAAVFRVLFFFLVPPSCGPPHVPWLARARTATWVLHDTDACLFSPPRIFFRRLCCAVCGR